MADVYLSSADVATFNKLDMDLQISDVLDETPFLNAMAARTTMGSTFAYNKKTANPSVGFRAVNDGIENTDGTYVKVTLSLGVLDASFAVDVAAAMEDERGLDHIMAIEAQAHLRQAMREFEEQILNGTNANANGFDGFADQSNLDALADDQVVTGGGSGSDVTSVYLVRTGEADCQALWGQQGVISIGDRQVVERAGSSTGRFGAYYHNITGWVGLKIGSIHSVVRIANLEQGGGSNTLDDDKLAEAISVFPSGRGPSYIVMNRPVLSDLQQSRTATNATGAPAPFPSEAFGIPIIVTDSLGNETAIS